VAKKIVDKAVFCVDNLDPSTEIADLCNFVRGLSVYYTVVLTLTTVTSCWIAASGQTQ